MLREIEAKSHLVATAVANNTHLQEDTDEAVVAAGIPFAQEVARLAGLPLACWLGQTWGDRVLLALVLVVALLVELLNSAIENVVDRISPELHPLSKKAKDMGSAAQFTAQICILVVWGTYLIGRFF